MGAKMSSELAQTERAFQKQQTVVYNAKKGSTGAHSKRHVRAVGLGFKTPRTAKDGNYVDKKCPAPSSSVVISFTSSRSTVDSRSATTTWPSTCPHVSWMLTKVILSLLASAVPFQRLSDSM